MGIRAMIVVIVVAMCGSFVWAAGEPEAIDWGAWRVKVEERWLGAEVGWDLGQKPRAGIGFSRPGRAGEYAILDYQMGWMAEDGQGAGIAGMLEGELAMEERLQVVSFGRKGSEIGLVMVVRPAGGILPAWVEDVVRRKLGAAEGSRMPVSLKDARAAGLQGKKVAFAGAFPEDLPAGEYRVVAELRDEAGQVKQRYEKRLVKQEKVENPLESLTGEQLLKEYVKRGEALKGTGVEPLDSRFGRLAAAFPYDSPPSMAWKATHREIVRRGKQMVPALMLMLEAEAVRNPGETNIHSEKFGFAFDVMRMLEEIGDPRPVPLLVRVMEGMDGKVNLPVRMQAEDTAESLTFMSFSGGRTNHLGSRAVMQEGDLVRSTFNDPPQVREAHAGKVAALFAEWLAGEARDPARWLPLARSRARKAMERNDPARIGNAIEFMTGGYWGDGHDDQPEITMKAIARFLNREDTKAIEGKADIGLTDALAHYGPSARRYVGGIIDKAKQRRTWTDFMGLTRVGGEQAVAYMVQVLPELRKSVEDRGIGVNVDADRMSDMEARQAVLAYRVCRWGIERWAGRVFETDKEITAWWEQAKGRSQQQWLEESLEQTAVEADRGNAKAQYILRSMVPDLPDAEDDLAFDPPWQRREGMPYREKGPGAYREKWVRENRARLGYDEVRSCFVIRK